MHPGERQIRWLWRIRWDNDGNAWWKCGCLLENRLSWFMFVGVEGTLGTLARTSSCTDHLTDTAVHDVILFSSRLFIDDLSFSLIVIGSLISDRTITNLILDVTAYKPQSY